MAHFSDVTVMSMPIMWEDVPPLYSLPVYIFLLSVDTRFCSENIRNVDKGGLCGMHGRGKECR
jgi:hypothetical protein